MAKATKKLSAKQQEILDLLNRKVEVEEIAELLETSVPAIHQQMTRMRAAGALPKAKRGGRRTRKATSTPAAPEGKENGASVAASVASNNGGTSLEDHLSGELGSATERIAEIQAERARLEAEEGTLGERAAKLRAAQEVLTA